MLQILSGPLAAIIPLLSDLVIRAWEHYLKDYPDKILIQYLKFGLPLSINGHTKFTNTNVNNHASAIHFLDEIAVIYVHKCVQPARIFINQILALFRTNVHKKHIKLNEEFYRDID